jgi:hypothetical protein
MGAKKLTYWKYRVVFAFYLRAIALNPKRWMRIISNFFSEREDSKFDSFMRIMKQRFFTKRAAKT